MMNQPLTRTPSFSKEALKGQPATSVGRKASIYFILAMALALCLPQVGCIGLTGSAQDIPGNPFAPKSQPAPGTTSVTIGPGGTFGTVAVGSSSSQTITVTNSGSATLSITQLSVAGTGFSASGYSLPLSIAPNASASISTTFTPTAAGAATGSLSLTGDTTPAVSSLALTGMGTQGQPQISVTPNGFAFGGVNLGASASLNLTITNSGSTTLSVSNIAASGAGYTVSGFSLPVSISAGQSSSFSVKFAPTSAGSLPGSITVTSNAASSPTVVSFTGNGMAGQLTANPLSISFGNISVGSSGSQTVTLTNGGANSITISQATPAGAGFGVTGLAIPLTIGGGQSISFAVTYAPSTPGSIAGAVTLTSNAPNPIMTILTSGTGIQPGIGSTPSSVNFNSVTIGSPNSQTVLLQNPGTASLTVSQANVSGAGYSISGLSLPATIAAGGSTTFNVAFAPGSAATIPGSISLVNNSPTTPYTISLTGTGAAATHSLSASSSSLTFSNGVLGTNLLQSVTLTNSGNTLVTIGTVTSTGAAFLSSGVTAGMGINAGQTATLLVTYVPVLGNSTGNVSITSNATNSPISISLSGTTTQAVSHSVSLSWTASTSTVVGYNVYRSTTSAGPYTLITSSTVAGASYSDTTVQAALTYFYVVTAVDSSGNESAYSNEASATVPTP